jgi:hypothetical protein
MDIDYLLIYLVFYFFHQGVFYFVQIKFEHVLLGYQSIHFGGVNVNGIMFCISNPT